MEDSLENLISYMEMEDEELNQSSISSNFFDEQEFLKDIILEEPECEPYSNKIQNNSTNTIINVTSPTNSVLSFDDNIATIHQSNSSNSIMSLEDKSCVSNSPSSPLLPSTYLLSFDKSPSIIEVPMSHSDKRRVKNIQSSTNKVSRKVKSETQDHLMAERKRRRELTENIIALSAIIPGLKKMDKCYVLSEAVSYTKHLQNRIEELENQNKENRVNPEIFMWKSQSSSNKRKCSQESMLEVEARVLEKEVLIRIHCEKKQDIVLKIHKLLDKFNLTITTSTILPFGASTLVINIFAKMEEEDSIIMDELVKDLKKYLVEACETKQ